MSAQIEQKVLSTLAQFKDPVAEGTLVDTDRVVGLQVRDGHVSFALDVGEPAQAKAFQGILKEVEKAVHGLDGVLSVSVALTADRPAPTGSAPQGRPAQQPPQLLSEVKSIIAVSSAKGGVGKSTTSVNLAIALAKQGLSVGLLDADIYGPSVPRMMGITDKPQSLDGKKLEPLENHGVKCMSIGFLVEEDTPMIWRGPMVQGALEQLMRDVNWGALDVMVVDMPPGTGDIQLTMAQKVPLTGSVIVSTPQDIALLDTRKGLNMFRKVEIPVFGIVENMSYLHRHFQPRWRAQNSRKPRHRLPRRNPLGHPHPRNLRWRRPNHRKRPRWHPRPSLWRDCPKNLVQSHPPPRTIHRPKNRL